MNFDEGLKRLVNVIFWLWFGYGVFSLVKYIIWTLLGYEDLGLDLIVLILLGIILPFIFKKLMFYVIEGFFKSK